jgi:hypothetical protein
MAERLKARAASMKIAWISALGALLLGALTASACGNDRFIVIGTTKAPSASGFVEMLDQRSDGAKILVHLEQLFPPSRVDPTAKYYVVWIDGRTSSLIRAGVLSYNPEQRTGDLRTDAPFKKFIVKITAETTDKPSAPSELEVASQEVLVDD